MLVNERRLSAAVACAALVVLSACSASGVKDALTPGPSTPSTSPDAPATPIVLSPNVEQRATDVDVSTIVTVLAQDGKVRSGRLKTDDGSVSIPGHITAAGWVADQRLEPGTAYRLSVSGSGDDGVITTVTRRFTTRSLTLQQQTYPSVAPLEGETVGVGMPVIVTFDVPVKNRKLFEQHMSVTTSPAVTGSWTWFSDREAHFRPQHFWPAHTRVNVRLRLNSLPAGGGIYGQQDQDIDFTIGSKVVSTVNVDRHRLKYTVDDKLVRTIPVTTGDAGHQTRNGTKVIMEKFSTIDMDAATTGVEVGDAGYYNMKDVRWAMRLTNSGEFLHAAPWSAAAQGRDNVSHGCTGMSMADAGWLFQRSRRGDVVRYVNSARPLEARNGWTDWNEPWDEWTAGSALHVGATETDGVDDGVNDS